MSGQEDIDARDRRHTAPFSGHHPIPTVQNYRKEKQERDAAYGVPEEDGPSSSRTQRAREAYDRYKHGETTPEDTHQPYQSENKNLKRTSSLESEADPPHESRPEPDVKPEDGGIDKDTSEVQGAGQDPKAQRKEMKKRDGGTEREVTDPVTHLPVKIRDFTSRDLKHTEENETPPGLGSRVGTGQLEDPEEDPKIQEDAVHQQEAHSALETLFPPPNFDAVKQELSAIYERAIVVGVVVVSTVVVTVSLFGHFTGFSKATAYSTIFFTFGVAVAGGTAWGLRQWAQNKVNDVWENETWEAERQAGKAVANKARVAESTQWLNSLLASVFPLINPDLFVAIQDQLEDVMQASLPKMVRMVSVEDLGQGSESFRILGIKWLPSGAAAHSVDKDGAVQAKKPNGQSDRKVPGEGEVSQESEKKKDKGADSDDTEQQNEDQENIGEGMEAEEGDFVNMEIALSYRARGGGRSLRSRAKHAHLYMAFYLIGGVKFPVWVELHGFVGVLRVRMQLTPDPPFISLCTMTFLGQPKVDLSCVPLSKHALNIMDLPVISNFVQSAVDAGLSTLVAPRNLTLDLKDMLTGDDFKKDTTARGILMVTIKRGYEFKEGDSGIGPFKKGSSDPYVSVGWAKFGKPVWSTRVLMSEMEPSWQETAFILVTPEELNVDERLRVQLWDSDRTSADDDLGRIEVDLKHIMKNEKSNGKVWERQDGFRSLKKDESMPGKLDWSIGYFSKPRILNSQLAEQTEDAEIKSVEDLQKKVDREAERKLREARKDETNEIEQQKAQDFKEREDQLIIRSPPPQEYPTGILSIQLHNITGLELETTNKKDVIKRETNSDVNEEGDDLPSAYCTIILNHQKIYKTRTKPKNAKPFFNAGCERVVRDWRNTEVHVSVRDARVHENDALLGVVFLPLGELLSKRSQFSEHFPLSGGVGFGKIRISLVFRAIKLQAPRELLGWEFGTIEVNPEIKALEGLPSNIQSNRLKLRTNLGKGKMKGESGVWKPKGGSSLKLAVRRRYSSCMIIEFRENSALRDNTTAFCVLWLKDIPDEEEQTLKLTVWKGDLERAQQNCLDSYGEKLGAIEVKLAFWEGLSGYHTHLASKDTNIGDVMEVLDTAADNDDESLNFMDDRNGSDSSSSSSSDDEDTPTGSEKSNVSDDGKRGIMSSVKDYKHHSKELHRKNRGLMQWKIPRTADWLKGKMERGERNLSGLFKHHERETGIETEV